MRTALWATALLALLLAVSTSATREPYRRSPGSEAAPGELEIALAWVGDGAWNPAGDRWRETYRVANRGGVPSGPLQLRLRTPLGLAADSSLATNLDPGAELRGSVAVALRPGLSELCLDVRALEGERTRPEADSANNRVCRRLARRQSARAPLHAIHRPEDVP